ncbi:O-antigen flippase Wzx [Streptococcus sp. DD10]|uniref:lipopolysaccharide biosynthesis protein n=1 Tax=Streptococcus sp. DD10 TaxID=1777878 RepID=UPI000791FC97|nr:polysaccharide biosynthesis C-terminal domain-containing protein [Streptococcus sp. DD10]KXT76136.1 O-antigen flippase Wzx [Streptococcus sp. DD10]
MKRLSLRKKNFLLNTLASLLNYAVLIASGFILPRAMLVSYGSEINGLVSSITQFLGFISFLQAGVGTVVQVALYQPLHEKNLQEIGRIYQAAQTFFRKIALIFLVYTFLLAVLYPLVITTSLSHVQVSLLIVIIATNLFSQYYFGLTNTLLLNADQKAYIPLLIQTLAVLLNVSVNTVLIYAQVPVITVQVVSNSLYLLPPIILSVYVRKRYRIELQEGGEKKHLQSKWDGFVQHIAAVIVDNTDMIILTLFASLTDVSIYYVYYLVVNAVKLFLNSLSGGIQPLFGNILVRKELAALKTLFLKFEVLFGYVTTILYTSVLCLVLHFVAVYTAGIENVEFIQPIFSVLMVLSFAMFGYRTIYYTLIKAAGHFRETQVGALVEVILNIVISFIGVWHFGLLGVALGTLISVSYRTLYCVHYLSKNIINRNKRHFYKNMLANSIVFILSYGVTMNWNVTSNSYLSFLVLAVPTALLVLLVATLVYGCVYHRQIFQWYSLRKLSNTQ